jgi:hypothetical protein
MEARRAKTRRYLKIFHFIDYFLFINSSSTIEGKLAKYEKSCLDWINQNINLFSKSIRMRFLLSCEQSLKWKSHRSAHFSPAHINHFSHVQNSISIIRSIQALRQFSISTTGNFSFRFRKVTDIFFFFEFVFYVADKFYRTFLTTLIL